jgi:hypothetical protein
MVRVYKNMVKSRILLCFGFIKIWLKSTILPWFGYIKIWPQKLTMVGVYEVGSGYQQLQLKLIILSIILLTLL